MKRLLLALGLLLSAFPTAARAPRVLFDLPYTIQHGYYVVWIGTPAGDRRFVFDTGCSRTTICESLRRELGVENHKTISLGDFEGHRADIARIRMDSLRMGELLFRNIEADVLPDSSFVFACMGFDGIMGCDLLRNLIVRLPNADSTITVTSDIRALGPLDAKRSVRFVPVGGRPMVPVSCGAPGKGAERSYALFDTGSNSWFSYCRHAERKGGMIDRGIAADTQSAEGFPASVGWTNRIARTRVVRGYIPTFTFAGVPIGDMPFRTTAGYRDVMGTAVLQWGQAVIDFRQRRFWFLPATGEPIQPPREPQSNITPALLNRRLIVGMVWDESLRGVIAPGDRVVQLGTIPVDTVDVCTFLRGEFRRDKPQIGVERKDGTRVTVPIN